MFGTHTRSKSPLRSTHASTKTMSFSLHASTSAVSSRVLTSSVASSNKRVAPARAAFSVRAADAGASSIFFFFLPFTKRDRRRRRHRRPRARAREFGDSKRQKEGGTDNSRLHWRERDVSRAFLCSRERRFSRFPSARARKISFFFSPFCRSENLKNG